MALLTDGKPNYSVLIDTSRIKPCPCCGRMPVIEIEVMQSMGITNMLYNLYCSLYSCNMPQKIIATKLQDAIKAWNALADEIKGGKNENNN